MTMKTTLAAFALCAPLAAGAALAQADEYAECLEMADRAPEVAREFAARWEITGGGSRARHCAAIALIGLGAEREAAKILTEIGAESTDLTVADRASALTLAGELWLRLDQPKLAALSYERAHQLADPIRATRIGLARAYAAEGEWTASLEELNGALELDPLDVEALTLRAAAYRAVDDPNAALLDATRATDLEPASPLSWFERGAAFRALGDDKRAEASWINASILDPTGPVGDLARFNLQQLILKN